MITRIILNLPVTVEYGSTGAINPQNGGKYYPIHFINSKRNVHVFLDIPEGAWIGNMQSNGGGFVFDKRSLSAFPSPNYTGNQEYNIIATSDLGDFHRMVVDDARDVIRVKLPKTKELDLRLTLDITSNEEMYQNFLNHTTLVVDQNGISFE